MLRFLICAYLAQIAKFGRNLPGFVCILALTAIIKELAGCVSLYDIQS